MSEHDSREEYYSHDMIISIMGITEEINKLNDIDMILDRILLESRKLANADAGSIFLADKDQLTFSYVHNDTLFIDDDANAALYANFSVPINKKSIVGYTALTGELVAIDDAYTLSGKEPYSFNTAFDQESGYRTTSILSIPLKTFEDKLVGVMQLINAKDDQGEPVPFSEESCIYIPILANHASVAIERGIMHREMILRMMRMTELHDEQETAGHVQRVGAYAAEIYHCWANKRGIDKKELKSTKDLIRLAAMLHDVGKVGISETILKKPGKLTDEEFTMIKWHTVFGARLFEGSDSAIDRMSREIALYHHEKWAGNGYPGNIPDLFSNTVHLGQPYTGEEIPLAARITAIADVYDTLASRRAYKDPWPDDKILATFEEEKGQHFDPEVVEAFMQIFKVIKAIQAKYTDEPG